MNKLCGQCIDVIDTIIISPKYKEIKCYYIVPEEGKLLNFDLDNWLVLDNYGNDTLGNTITERVFGAKMFDYTISISRDGGEVFITSFSQSSRHPQEWYGRLGSALLTSFDKPIFIPKKYLKRLDELKSKKRPFRLTFTDWSWSNFMDREIGFSGMQPIVELDFDKKLLQVSANFAREISYL